MPPSGMVSLNSNAGIRVLVLEDNPSDADLMVDALVQAGLVLEWERVETEDDFSARLSPDLDLILSDYALPQFTGLQALRIVRSRGLEVPFILVSGNIGEDIAVEAMRDGADDYLLKDRMARLGPAALQALERRRLRSARARAESERRESDERFRQLAENIREVFWLTDPSKQEMLYVSPAYEEIWGRECKVLHENPLAWLEAIHPDDRERVAAAARSRQIRGDYDEEYRIVRPDGAIRWIRDRAFPVQDATGSVFRIAGVAEDITKQKRAAEELRESERRYGDMLTNVRLVSMMLDREARITYCNDYLLRLTGWRREEVLGRDWFELFLPPPYEELKDVFAALLMDLPEAWHHENEILTRAGARRRIRWNNTVLRSSSGDVIGTASIGEDITDRKLQEQKIEKLSRIRTISSLINALIVRVNDRRELFDEACRIAVEHGNFGIAWIGEFHRATLEVMPVAWAGLEAKGYLSSIPSAIGEDRPQGQGILAKAIRTRTPVFDNDITRNPSVGGARRLEAIRRGFRSGIGLPLIVEGQVTGTLALFAKELNFFDEEEVSLLTELAGNISLALEHMARQQKLERLSRIRAVSSEINAAIVRIRDREELLRETCRIASEHGKFELVWVATLEVEKQAVNPVAWSGFSEQTARAVSWARINDARATIKEAMQTRRPAIRNDIGAEVPPGALREEALKRGCLSTICLPFIEDDQIVAVMNVFAMGRDFFDDEELALLTELAGNISFAVEHMARQQKLEKLSRIRAVSSEINAAIVRIHERETLLQETCRIAVEHGKFDLVWVGEIDQELQRVRPVASMGFSRETAHAVTWASIGSSRGTLGEAILTRKPAVRNDMEAEMPAGKLRQEALQRGCNSTVCLPLLLDEKVVAAVILFAAGKNFFDEQELALLLELAADVSFALQTIARQERLDYVSYYDTLTGLPNRTLFLDRAGQQMQAHSDAPHIIAVTLVNLERFRNVNESLGRQGGDELLKLVAQRLERAFHGKDYLARIVADTFGVVVRGIRDAASAVHIVENQILACFRDPYELDGRELRIAAKAGIAVFPADGGDAATLFKNAEVALKKAHDSSERYLFYAADMNARAAQLLSLETRLRKAVEAEQFVLHYQPKIDLASGVICGLEALIRWQEPGGGLVAPGAFIPMLEETGLILEVGRWALGRALADHREWTARGCRVPRIAVNVSAIQLQQRDFADMVIEVVQQQGDNPDALELEVTESLLMKDIQTSIRKLSILRGLGIHIAMDDFGTGHSSLSYLARLPINCLKIDRSFVNAMASGPQDMAIVETIIALARSLKLKVVAEGVETEAQAETLASLKCDEAQGYLYSKPVPPADIESRLRKSL